MDTETPKKDFRYKVQHMGDAFVGLLQSVSGAAVDSAEGLIDAVEEWQVKGRQKKKIMEIGAHAVRIRNEKPDLFDDDEIQVVFRDYDELQAAVDRFVERRELRARRAKDRFCKCDAGEEAAEAAGS
ncbi:MAG: hypothetical protein MI863_21500 [Desulfobacterales bacterium]|nr:hypothetical protein [Desulfobacterales bacterium]